MRKHIAIVVLTACLLVGSGCSAKAVPNVTGKSMVTATDMLEEMGFAVGEVKYDDSSSARAGEVIAQSPGAGTLAGKGAKIDLTIAGAPPVSVPDLRGKSAEEAKMMLGVLGLRLAEPTIVTDANAEPGTIVEQVPAAGEYAFAGSSISVTLNDGTPVSTSTLDPAFAGVPNVQGMPVDQATNSLRASGFQVVVQAQGGGSPGRGGTVVSQTLKPGSGGTGGTVVIVVSGTDATPKKAVPQVSGLPQAEATAKLKASGFEVKAEDWWLYANLPYNEAVDANGNFKYEVGEAFRQFPQAGELVKPGSTVTIHVFRR